MKILVTCPPMVKRIDNYKGDFEKIGWEFFCPNFQQVLEERELIEMLPDYDGWIIGDDPATERVFSAGASGSLKAAVKWGVGTDNIDFLGAEKNGILVQNTPGVFGAVVADVAIGYLILLARELHLIHEKVKKGIWHKISGTALYGKNVAVIGFGDIGRNFSVRAEAMGLTVTVIDPFASNEMVKETLKFAKLGRWPEDTKSQDFIVFTCALTKSNFHMLDDAVMRNLKEGVRIINVARGPLIDEGILVTYLKSKKIASAALDVFEVEPLPADSPLLNLDNVILGSHNSSNTVESVDYVSRLAIEKLHELIKQKGLK